METISRRCQVVSWSEFQKLKELEPHVYYLAGSYDPVNKRVKLEADLED